MLRGARSLVERLSGVDRLVNGCSTPCEGVKKAYIDNFCCFCAKNLALFFSLEESSRMVADSCLSDDDCACSSSSSLSKHRTRAPITNTHTNQVQGDAFDAVSESEYRKNATKYLCKLFKASHSFDRE